MEKPKVYIASPYTSSGNQARNVGISIDVFIKLLDAGFTPFSPLLVHFIEIQYERDYDVWLQYGLEWMKICDCVLRLPGESKGADAEVKMAGELGIPVFDSIEELQDYYLREHFYTPGFEFMKGIGKEKHRL